MLPVYLIESPKDGKGAPELPADGLCFLVCATGAFKRINNEFYESIQECKEMKGLAKLTPEARLKVKLLPYSILKEAENFFAAIYKRQKSEAVVTLYAHPKYGWHVAVPPQTAVGLHVDYDMKNEPTTLKGWLVRPKENPKAEPTVRKQPLTREEQDVLEVVEEFEFRLFGTIHSHASAGAFHSGTDHKDEMHFDGLHITIGNVDNVFTIDKMCSYSAHWYLHGVEYKASMEKVVEAPPLGFFDERWLSLVRDRPVVVQQPQQLPYHYNPHVAGNYQYRDHSYPPGSRAGVGAHTGGLVTTDAGGVYEKEWFEGRGTQYWREKNGNTTPPGAQPGAQKQLTTSATTEVAGTQQQSAVADKDRGKGEPATESEVRMYLLHSFKQLKSITEQMTFFNSLEEANRKRLIDELVTNHPVDYGPFLKVVGAVNRNSSNGNSDDVTRSTAVTSVSTSTVSQGSGLPMNSGESIESWD